MKIEVVAQPNKGLKRKVLIFAITYLPYQGGAEVAVREITDRLPGPPGSEVNFEFDLVTGRYDKKLPTQERLGNVNVYRVGGNLNINSKLDKIFCTLRILALGLRLHKQRKYNIVWSLMATWAGIASLFFKLLHPSTKYLLTMQSGDSDLFIGIRTQWWNFIYKHVYLKADFIQVISEWLKVRALNYGYKGPISVVPNGVNINNFNKSTNQQINKIELKSKLELPKNSKLILSVSRLVKKNGMEYLIKAVHILITNYQLPITLVLIGPGKLEMQLKDLAYDLDIDDEVKFLGDVPNKDVPIYYKLADVFVRPSLSEGQGISFIEAMATGLPIIGTKIGGIPDFLKDGQTGLFCKVEDPQDLAQKIKILLENDELREKIIKNSLKLVEEQYDWERIVVQIREIFNKI